MARGMCGYKPPLLKLYFYNKITVTLLSIDNSHIPLIRMGGLVMADTFSRFSIMHKVPSLFRCVIFKITKICGPHTSCDKRQNKKQYIPVM